MFPEVLEPKIDRAEVTITSPGALCELMVVDETYDRYGRLVVTPSVESNYPEHDDISTKLAKHALVQRRKFDSANELISCKIEINSPHILKALVAVVSYYPGHPGYFTEQVTLKAPYMLLQHHWAELEEYKNILAESSEDRVHVDFLLSFMEREMGEARKASKRLINVGQISFPLLWTIFKPGQLVFSTASGHPQLYRLQTLTYANCGSLNLRVCCTEYDGTVTGRYSASLSLYESAVGEAAIINRLNTYPFEYAENRDGLLEKLKARGQKFLHYRGIYVQRYKGILQLLRQPPLGFFSNSREDYCGTFTPKNVEGRIIIDTKTFMEENPAYDLKLSDHDTPAPRQHNSKSPKHTIMFWAPVDPVLCPPYVLGFSPALKQWCQFSIDKIEEPKWVENAFDRVILNPTPKKVIKSLVSWHEFPDTAARDQQELKGKGLVMLLHGTPGTGKTLTAEAVAEHTKRALLVISSGELGTTVAEIDNSLTKFLQYAALWKAIVLIDEADVFLEARLTGVSNRLEQNSLVAVFLRQLEYFRGIVFLTSNRGSGLDPAIRSRIHLFLQFSPPDLKTRRAMWEQVLQRFSPDEIGFVMEDVLDLLSMVDMNGREISNASQLIRTLAREESKKVTSEHIKTFLQVWNCFEGEEAEGMGIIGKGGKVMRSAHLKGVVCEKCGCGCADGIVGKPDVEALH